MTEFGLHVKIDASGCNNQGFNSISITKKQNIQNSPK